MQYLLTEEEFHNFVPKARYEEAIKKIDNLNLRLLEKTSYSCHQGSGFGYCDKCPIGSFGTQSCNKSYKRYSK